MCKVIEERQRTETCEGAEFFPPGGKPAASVNVSRKDHHFCSPRGLVQDAIPCFTSVSDCSEAASRPQSVSNSYYLSLEPPLKHKALILAFVENCFVTCLNPGRDSDHKGGNDFPKS